MKPSDSKKFGEAMAILGAVLSTEVSDAKTQGFWYVLKGYEWADVEKALGQAMTRKWYPFPQPADILELMNGSTEDRAEMTWAQLWEMFNSGGSTYRSLYCEDHAMAEAIRMTFGSWQAAGMCPRPDSDNAIGYQTYHKTWVASYKAASHAHRPFDRYLKGLYELSGSTVARLILMPHAGAWKLAALEEIQALMLPGGPKAIAE